VFIDLDTGMNRTGVAMGGPAMDLLNAIARSDKLKFGGLQAYAGEVQHLKGYEFRRMRSRDALSRALETRHQMERAGYDVPVLSVGRTGTYNIDAAIDGVTDIQAGSYLFMDVDYRVIGGERGEVYDDFAPSLFVLTTAISQPMPGRITVDAGSKAMAVDKTPVLRDFPGTRYRSMGDEHGVVEFGRPGVSISVGDKLALIASHCDPTVNLYDHYFACRNEQVEAVWPVAGRGLSQ
jgi:D-serine deaminase-like pyridoxal phosphate-dependent protein